MRQQFEAKKITVYNVNGNVDATFENCQYSLTENILYIRYETLSGDLKYVFYTLRNVLKISISKGE